MTQFSLTIMTREIASALASVIQVIDTGAKIPILKTTRITVADGIAEFVGTNTMQTVIARAACAGEGAIAIDAASLEGKIRALRQSEPVTITQDGAFVTVSQGRTRWKTPVLPASDFPGQVASVISGDPVQVTAKFMDAVRRAGSCVDPNEPREMLRGVHLSDVAVATDGRSLALISGDATFPGITIPHQAIAAIGKMTGDITAIASDKAIQFSSEWMTFKTQLIEAHYPDFRRVIPTGMTGEVHVDRQALAAAVTRAASIRADGDKAGAYIPLTMKIREDEIEIFTSNREGEEGSDFVPCERISGPDADIRMAGSLLIRAINSLDCDNVQIGFEDFRSPIVMSPIGSDRENIRIVMPRQK